MLGNMFDHIMHTLQLIQYVKTAHCCNFNIGETMIYMQTVHFILMIQFVVSYILKFYVSLI